MPKQTPNKPTPEELKAQEEEAIEAAEELEGRQSIPEEKSEEDENTEVEETPAEEGEAQEESVEEAPVEEAEPSKELYKKKFSASSRENQRINAKNRVINQAIIEADDIPAPTDEEMQGIYGEDWDLASDIEKESLKETQISRKWRAKIKEASDQATKIEKWNESVDEYVGDPKTLIDNPDLENNTNEFREFAIQDENNNVPMKILVSAFLHQHSTEKTNNKGRMFERALGGSNEKPKPKNGKISLDEARRLRETNYSKYKEYLSTGKIEMDI